MGPIKPQHKTRTETFRAAQRKSNEHKERADCSVKAVAIACGTTYEKAHAALAKLGRKPRRGAKTDMILKAVNEFGYKTVTHKPEEFIKQYGGNSVNMRHVTPHQVERFPEVWAKNETYLFFTRGHVLAVVNGKVHDHTRGRCKHVRQIMKVVDEDVAGRNRVKVLDQTNCISQDDITYGEATTTKSGRSPRKTQIPVRLGGKLVGWIENVCGCPGYSYRPKGAARGGMTFPTIVLLKHSIEGEYP